MLNFTPMQGVGSSEELNLFARLLRYTLRQHRVTVAQWSEMIRGYADKQGKTDEEREALRGNLHKKLSQTRLSEVSFYKAMAILGVEHIGFDFYGRRSDTQEEVAMRGSVDLRAFHGDASTATASAAAKHPALKITDDVLWLLGKGYSVAPRDSAMLMVLFGDNDRVRQVAKSDATYMIFDPSDSADGFLLLGDDLVKMAKEARQHLDV